MDLIGDFPLCLSATNSANSAKSLHKSSPLLSACNTPEREAVALVQNIQQDSGRSLSEIKI